MSPLQESKEPAARSTDAVSALSPIDPSTVSQSEEEKSVPWVVRKLYDGKSITGRIIMSSYESFRAAGTSVVCLSPWGDSSPLLLPCIRFRDLAIHLAIASTGGMAAVAAPIMGPVSDVIAGSLGDSIIVEVGLHVGFDLGSKLLNDAFIDKPLDAMISMHDKRLETTKVKSVLITLKYHHTIEDASLGFFRSSLHGDSPLFSSVLDYLGVEKGWFSPYLFASGRRPIIPRTIKPDVIFCHGPFLTGDYKIGETLMAESASLLSFCEDPIPFPRSPSPSPPPKSTFSKLFHRESSPMPSASPDVANHESSVQMTQPPPPRRMVIVLVGLKPHRTLWTTSKRPSESILYYQLLNGVPAIVLPVKSGAPLLAWDSLTLEQLWKIDVKKPEGEKGGIWGVLNILTEYLEFCVAFDRVVIRKETANTEKSTANQDLGADSTAGGDDDDQKEVLMVKRTAIRNALTLLLIGAIRSGESKEVKKEVDKERSGIAMWRIP